MIEPGMSKTESKLYCLLVYVDIISSVAKIFIPTMILITSFTPVNRTTPL